MALLPPGVPKREEPSTYPEMVTHYFPIYLGKETGLKGFHATGVFLPDAFDYPPVVDVILFFHGTKQGWKTVRDFWAPGNGHGIHLRESLNAAKRSAILVVPTMGDAPGNGGPNTGTLDEAGRNADELLDEVLRHLTIYDDNYDDRPSVGKLILAAHSGGGEPMLQQTMLMKKYLGNIKAVWGFDCTYEFGPTVSNADNWINWAAFHRDVEHHFHYQTGTAGVPGGDTETVARAIEAMASGKAPLPHKPKEKGVFVTLPHVHVHGSNRSHYAQLNAGFHLRVHRSYP